VSLFNNLKANIEPRWQALNSREKRLVGSGLVVLVVVVIYYGLWMPLQTGIAQRQAAIDAQQSLLDWTRQATGAYLARSSGEGSRSSGEGSGSISQRITEYASANSITITRMQPQSGGLLLVIDEVGFNQLLNMLDSLQSQQGLRVDSLDIAEGGAAGMVRVRKLQVSED
jgi:general secretion pathway protein M